MISREENGMNAGEVYGRGRRQYDQGLLRQGEVKQQCWRVRI
jgi:hypothetical protein